MVKPKAKERAQTALAHTSTYKEAVDSLRQYYEDNRLLFSHHFDVFHQPEVFKDSVEDLDYLEAKCKAAIRGFQSSQGYTAEQLMAATLERMVTPSLQKQWRQYTCEESEPPLLKILLNIVERQWKSAPDERLSTPKQESDPRFPCFHTPRRRSFIFRKYQTIQEISVRVVGRHIRYIPVQILDPYV